VIASSIMTMTITTSSISSLDVPPIF